MREGVISAISEQALDFSEVAENTWLMIDHAITRIRQLVADKKVTLKQVADAAGLSISTVHEMVQPDWSTRAVTNLKSLEVALPTIEALVQPPAEGATP